MPIAWQNGTWTLASVAPKNTPTGQLQLAREFLTAAETAFDPPANRMIAIRPTYWLVSHAMELTLKAFLLAKAQSEKELKESDVRHNIEGLMNMAIQSGLGMPDHVKNVFSGVSRAHESFYFRYGAKDDPFVTVPHLIDALAGARAALDLVASELQQ